MTIKETLSEKIEELNIVKEKLVDASIFLDPNNDFFIYHSFALDRISGSTGSTPNNLSEILDTISSEILKYSDYIKKIPNVSSSIIKRDRGVYSYAILSNNGGISSQIQWDEVYENASFMSLQQFLPVSTYKGGIEYIRVDSSPSFRKGGEGNEDIQFDIVVIRINPRLNIIEEYKAGNGILSVTLDNDHLYGDDVFIVGFRPKQKIIKTSVYYSKLVYTVKIKTLNGNITENTYSVGGTKVGNIVPNVDDTLVDGLVYWSMFTLNDFTVSGVDIQNHDMTMIPVISDIGTSYDGNILKEISVDGISIDVSQFKISFRSSVSERSILYNDTYRLYNKKETGISKIIFKNLRPIDIVLEEAINEL